MTQVFPGPWGTDTVAGSPPGAGETVICRLPGISTDFASRRLQIRATATITPGTACTAIELKIRRDGLTGPDVSPPLNIAVTAVATDPMDLVLETVDQPGAVTGQVYVLTATCTTASAVSSVHAASLAVGCLA